MTLEDAKKLSKEELEALPEEVLNQLAKDYFWEQFEEGSKHLIEWLKTDEAKRIFAEEMKKPRKSFFGAENLEPWPSPVILGPEHGFTYEEEE